MKLKFKSVTWVAPIGLLICLATISCTQKKSTGLFLPDDLEATLWAESPMLYNPTNMDVDAKGRIWITEAVNYRNFNNDSLHTLHFSKGDRVMILEDTDDDGVADFSKVFVQDKDLISPLGIAVLGNKVFVSCSPHLIVFTDDNGDDVPDKKEIFITGFGGKDHDHSLHSVSAGPDGLLYFNTGNAGPHIVTDKSGWTLRSGSLYTGGTPYNLENRGNMTSDDGHVWVGGLALRINPDGTGLKVMAHNFRNSYEVIPDSYGNLWQNDNDDQVVACRTTWIMEGGNAGYFSTDGTRYWLADQRPWQDIYSAHWHQQDPGVMPAGDRTGAGSPTGIAFYEGEALGEKYRGRLLSADAGRNVIFGYHPVIKQSGYDLGTRENFITSLSRDTAGYVWHDSVHYSKKQNWFRPSDVTIGTDGAIYVADWYDPIVGGHEMKDTLGYGRIYRISPKSRKLKAPALNLSSIQGQLEALKSPATNVRYAAFILLRSQGDTVVNEVRKLLDDPNPFVQSRAVFLLSQLGDEGISTVNNLLKSPNENLRIVALRALRQTNRNVLSTCTQLVNDPSPFVRREVATALRDVKFTDAKPLLLELMKQYDGTDRWMLETLGQVCVGHESELFREIQSLFNIQNQPAENWSPAVANLIWRLHPEQAVNDLKTRASSSRLNEQERDAALTALAFINTKSAANAMLELSKDNDSFIAERAVYWLAFRQSNDWLKLLDWENTGLDGERERTIAAMKVKKTKILDEQQAFEERKWNAQDMAENPIGGQMLIDLMTENNLPQVLVPVIAEKIFYNPDLGVRVQASKYFKRSANAENFDIRQILTLTGTFDAGKVLFETNCGTCHKVKGVGQDIGPDLTQISEKFDKTALLDAIINPSAGIVFGYEPWLIQMKNGTSYYGFMVADGAEIAVLKDISGNKINLQTNEIVSRKKQDQSLMPDPGGLGLNSSQVADIATYLLKIH